MSIPLTTPPGTKIVCVQNHAEGICEACPELLVGETYTLRKVFVAWNRLPTVWIDEVYHGDEYAGFLAKAFRLPVTLDSLTAVPSESPADLDRRTAPAPRKRVRA